MKAIAISTTENVRQALVESQNHGYLTFLYHHSDPEHELLRDKFLYVYSDDELQEKLNLLKQDVTAKDLIRL